MDINSVRALLNRHTSPGFDIYERRAGNYRLIVPIRHEDGDMLDVYLQTSPDREDRIRICDFGLTLMRISYTYEINTNARQRIFDSILINNNVQNEDGNLYLDSAPEMLYENILQFAGCLQKLCNMRYWSRGIIRSAFYDDLKDYITAELLPFSPEAELCPLADYPLISVDWSLSHNRRNFYIYGVRGNDKAKTAAISLLELQKANLPFISLVVHEDMEGLGRRERLYLTRNADKQYPGLNDFREKGFEDINRFAAAANGH